MVAIDLQCSAVMYEQMVAINLWSIVRSNILATGRYQFAVWSLPCSSKWLLSFCSYQLQCGSKWWPTFARYVTLSLQMVLPIRNFTQNCLTNGCWQFAPQTFSGHSKWLLSTAELYSNVLASGTINLWFIRYPVLGTGCCQFAVAPSMY